MYYYNIYIVPAANSFIYPVFFISVSIFLPNLVKDQLSSQSLPFLFPSCAEFDYERFGQGFEIQYPNIDQLYF